MKHGIRRFPALWRATRLARRWYHARFDAYPDWRSALAADAPLWQSAGVRAGRSARADGDGDRLLCARDHAGKRAGRRADASAAPKCTPSLRRRHDRMRRVRSLALSDVAKFVARGPSRDLCRDCAWPAERVYARARAEGPSLLRLADCRRSRRGAADREHVALRTDQGVHARRPGHRRACVRRRAAVLRDRLARGRSRRRTGAAQVSRVGAADGVRIAPADSRVGFRLGRLDPRHLRAMGHRRRGRARRRRARRHVERGVPEAAIHLQPRRHVSPHADERAARSLGGWRADGGSGPRADEVSGQPPGRAVRLDRVSPAAAAGCGRHRTATRARPLDADHRTADERHMGRAAPLSGQCVSEHARVAGPDVPVLRAHGQTCSCSSACIRPRSAGSRPRVSRFSASCARRFHSWRRTSSSFRPRAT